MCPQVFDYDRLCPTDDLLGTAEVYFTEEHLEEDEETGGQKVGCCGTTIVAMRSVAQHTEACIANTSGNPST
jgi:hypothetical protein